MARELQLAGRGDTGYTAFDAFSLYHAAFGLGFGAVGMRGTTALAVSLVWEGIEPGLKYMLPGPFPSNKVDQPINKLGDTCALMTGWLIGHKLRGRP